MKRYQQILAGLLVLQIILSVVVFWPKSAETSVGEPVFVDLTSDDIVELTITDDAGNTLVLGKDGDTWGLAEADDFPVQSDLIEPALTKLLALKTDRLVTRTEGSHKQLQVAPDDFLRRVEVKTTDGTTYVLYIGSSPRYSATHFRMEGEDETYLTSELTTWDLTPKAASWINTNYVTLDREELVEVVLENDHGTFTLVPEDDPLGDWTLQEAGEDEPVDPSKVSNIVSKVTNITMLRPLGAEPKDDYGIDDPAATATLKLAERTITLKVGAQDPADNSFVIRSSESPYYVRVSEYNMKPLVETTKEDFMKAPATPTPEASTP